MAPEPRSRDLDEVYDARTLAAIEGWEPRRGVEPTRARPSSATSGGIAGVLLSAGVLALREVFESEQPRQPVVEFDPETDDGNARWVTYLHVPGAPHASRIVVRPWLAPSAA
jgi:hypothetical protein